MNHQNPPDDQLRQILSHAKTIAIVGASNKSDKPSYRIMAQLLAAGYHVIPVNPKETAVLGQPAVASLADIKEPVDIVDVFRKSDETLWLQLGVSNEDTAQRAIAKGLTVVMDKCIGATHKHLEIAPKSKS